MLRIVSNIAVAIACVCGTASMALADDRPRLIVITDIGTEPDDIESMVRVLTYSNEIAIEGLIAATSRHLTDQVYPDLIAERVAAYGKVLPNLRAHDPRYPDAALLQSRILAGLPLLGMEAVGKGKDSPASRHIIAVVDKADNRPVWVSIWGGAAPLAQALWTVKATRSPAAVARFVAKLRVYSISDQDDTGPWARATFPHLFWIASIHGPTKYQLAAWSGISTNLTGADNDVVSKKWLRENIQKKGPLGALYPTPMFIMEGDTPSFLNLIDNGLSVPERPDWGGWGGRWEQPSPSFGHWADTIDQVTGVDGKSYSDNKTTVWRWRSAFQNDFAMRMQWSITPKLADANHPPKLVINGQAGSAPLTIMACPGQTVDLSAAGSSDPDGQALSYKWWRYSEASFLIQPVSLTKTEGPDTQFTMPVWQQMPDFKLTPLSRAHIVLEVSDSGTPKITRYRRVMIDVPTDGRMVAGKACPKIGYQARPQGIGFATGATAVSDAAYSTGDTEIGTMIEDPRLLPILTKYAPEMISAAKNISQARTMTLRAVANFIPGMTKQKLDEMDAELAKIPAK